MTKSDLIEKLAIERSVPGSVAEAVIAEVFSSMTDTLVSGNRIEIRGFGSFEIRDYDGRTARNPKSGDEVTVSAKKRPFFKVGKDLKERIASCGAVIQN